MAGREISALGNPIERAVIPLAHLPSGLWSWGGVYGHSWAVDPKREVSYVLMTSTAVEGMNGQLSMELMAAALAS